MMSTQVWTDARLRVNMDFDSVVSGLCDSWQHSLGLIVERPSLVVVIELRSNAN